MASSLRMSRSCRSQSSHPVGTRGSDGGSSTDVIEASIAQGYPAISLSVNDGNPARRLYESVGFVYVGKRGLTWTMVRHAARSN